MNVTGWMGVVLGLALTTASVGSGPVILDLGPVEPTPVPTPRDANRMRLVSTLTVQNGADGQSVISFEVSDMAVEKNERQRLIAAETYALSDDELKKAREAKPLAERIVRQIRALERDMLEYAEIVGPPKERAPLTK